MDLIKFFGEKLAQKTDKKFIVCAGLIRLSAAGAGMDLENITPRQFKQLFEGPVKDYLKKISVSNVDMVIKLMSLELSKNHAIFAMSV